MWGGVDLFVCRQDQSSYGGHKDQIEGTRRQYEDKRIGRDAVSVCAWGIRVWGEMGYMGLIRMGGGSFFSWLMYENIPNHVHTPRVVWYGAPRHQGGK